MKWNNKCQYTPASLREKSYEELYTLCLSAYTEGRTDERNKSLEAYRLRCSCLFGNKCMDSSLSVGVRKRICDDDTLLVIVEQTGPACHTGSHSCFFKKIKDFTE